MSGKRGGREKGKKGRENRRREKGGEEKGKEGDYLPFARGREGLKAFQRRGRGGGGGLQAPFLRN